RRTPSRRTRSRAPHRRPAGTRTPRGPSWHRLLSSLRPEAMPGFSHAAGGRVLNDFDGAVPRSAARARDRHVVRRRGRDPAIGSRSHPGKLAEVAAQVRLVGVAGVESDVDETGRGLGGEPADRRVEAPDAAVELRREADRGAEEGDEAAMAVAALAHRFVDVVRDREALERRCDRGMHALDARQPPGEEVLEESDPLLEPLGLEEALARLAGRVAPEVRERRVALRELVRRDAEERLARARAELRADRAERLGDLADVRAAPRAADHRVRERRSGPRVRVREDLEWVIRQPEDEVHVAAREDALPRRPSAHVLCGLARRPDRLHEGPEAQGGRSLDDLHAVPDSTPAEPSPSANQRPGAADPTAYARRAAEMSTSARERTSVYRAVARSRSAVSSATTSLRPIA